MESTLVVRIDGRQAEAAAASLESALARMGEQGDRTSDQVRRTESSVDRLKGGFMNLQGAVMALAGGMLVGKFVAVASETDRLRGSLQTMTGSAENASLAFSALEAFAAKTPFTLDQSVDAFIKLKSLGLEPTERALTSFGNTSSAMGKSMTQMIEAVADASTGEFERLKEFGIKSKTEGDRVKFTFQGVTTEIGKNSDEITEYLTKIGENNFAGAMDRQMEGLTGKLANLEDATAGLFRAFGDEAGTAALSGIVVWITEIITLLSQNMPIAVAYLKGVFFDMFAFVEEDLLEFSTSIEVAATAITIIWNNAFGAIIRQLSSWAKSVSDLLANIPVGIAQTAASGLADWSAAATDAAPPTRDLQAEVGVLTAKLAADSAAIKNRTAELKEDTLAIAYNKAGNVVAAGTLDRLAGSTRDASTETAGLTKEQKAAADAVAKHEQKVKDIIDDLKFDIANMRLSSREQAINTALRTADVTATSAQGQELARLTGVRYDEEEAIKRQTAAMREEAAATEKAKEELKKLTEQATPFEEAMTAAIERVDEAFAEAWKGAFDSFSSFADSLKNAFKQLLAELAHEAITRPIMIKIASSLGLGDSGTGLLSSIFGSSNSSTNKSAGVPQLGLVGSALKWGQSVWTGFSQSAGQGFSAMFKPITSLFTDAGTGTIGGTFTSMVSNITTNLKAAGNSFISAIGGKSNFFGSTGSSLASSGATVSAAGSQFVAQPIFEVTEQGIVQVGTQFGTQTGVDAAAAAGLGPQAGASWGSSIGTGLATAGAGMAGGFIGDKLGTALTDGRMATQHWGQAGGAVAGGLIGAGSAAMGAQFGAMAGPIGAAVGAAIGALIDIAFGTDNTKRMRLGVVAGDYNPEGKGYGATVTGASGLELTPVARRTEWSDANGMLDAFKGIDEALFNFAKMVGTTVDFKGVKFNSPNYQGSKNVSGGFFGSAANSDIKMDWIKQAPADFFKEWLSQARDDFPEEFKKFVDLFTKSGKKDIEKLIASFGNFSQAWGLLEKDAIKAGTDAYKAVKDAAEKANTNEAFKVFEETSAELSKMKFDFNPLSDGYDELNAVLIRNKDAVAQLALQYAGLKDEIDGLFGGVRTKIQESLMNPEQIYENRRSQMDDLMGKLNTATDPMQIENLVQQITALTDSVWSGLDESQKTTKGAEFLQFLDDAEAMAQARTQAGMDALEASQETLTTAIKDAMNAAAVAQQNAANSQQKAADTQLEAARLWFSGNGITMNIDWSSFNFAGLNLTNEVNG